MTEDYMTVGTHVSVLRRHWKALVVALLVGIAVGLVLVPLEKPSFQATSEVLVPNLSGTALQNQSIEDQTEIMTSDATLKTVIDQLKLTIDKSALAKQVSVANPDGTQILQVTVSNGNRREVAPEANAFASAYLSTLSSQITSVQNNLKTYYNAQLTGMNSELVRLRALLPTQSTTDKLATRVELTRVTDRRTKINSALGLVEQPAAPPQNGRVLHTATTPPGNARPWLRGVLVGIALGLVIGLAVAYGLDRRDRSIRDGAGLSGLLRGAPVLGRIPQDRATRQAGLALAQGGKESVVEAYRALATSLRFRGGARAARGEAVQQVVVVTSAADAEGKTSVAANVAVAAAGMGQRVILVDADLRRPALAEMFGLTGKPGLAELLRGEPVQTSVLQDVGIANLTVLLAGGKVDNAAELLATGRVESLLQELGRDADLVVIDSAPLLSVADTLPLAAAADHVVLVIRQGRTQEDEIKAALGRLSLVGATLSGAVLMGVSGHAGASEYHGLPATTEVPPAHAAGA